MRLRIARKNARDESNWLASHSQDNHAVVDHLQKSLSGERRFSLVQLPPRYEGLCG